MARRNITRLRFVVTQDAGQSVYTIDLAKALSIAERKLHRQMKNYHVVGGLVHDSNQNAFVRFNTAPDTWMTRAAIKRGFRMWKKQRSQVLSEAGAGISAGKYSDFKVYLNHQHGTTPLIPKDAGGNELHEGEWNYTTLVNENTKWNDPGLIASDDLVKDQFELQIVGTDHVAGTGAGQDTYSRVSLIKSWVDSRAQPDVSGEPVMPANFDTDPLTNLFNESDADDEILNLIDTEGDQTPYDESTFFGMQEVNGTGNNLQRMGMAHCSTANPTVRYSGFSAVCGLINLQVTTTGASGDVEIIMDVVTEGDKL